jgi:hypothetical protein
MPGALISKSYAAIKALATRQIKIEYDRIPYCFHDVPLKKILNWLTVATSVHLKPVPHGDGQPIFGISTVAWPSDFAKRLPDVVREAPEWISNFT